MIAGKSYSRGLKLLNGEAFQLIKKGAEVVLQDFEVCFLKCK
jgi:hypothetical protein